jgi:molecular chaperone DnaK (HSP70)
LYLIYLSVRCGAVQGGGKVLVVDMGCLQTTVLVLEVQPDLAGVRVLASEGAAALGAFHFDLAIFHHLATMCEEKHKLKIVPGTKAALRFLVACERLRKLLSQLPEVSEFVCECVMQSNL